MNKKITTLFMVISLFVIYLEIGYKNNIVLNSIFIMILCILQLIKNLFNVSFNLITVIQTFILVFSINFSSKEIFLLFPILFFELLKNKLSLEKSIAFLSLIMIVFFKRDIGNIFIYIVLLTLYLYEIKGREEENKNLKRENQTMLPKSQFYDEICDRNLLTNFRDTAKELKVKEKEFIKWLEDNKYIYRDNRNNIKPYSQYCVEPKRFFDIKDYKTDKFTGQQTFVTILGKNEFRIKLIEEHKNNG